MDKREKELQKKQEDEALKRLILWAVGAVILIGFLLVCRRYRVDFRLDEVDLAEGLFHASGIIAIVALVLAVVLGALGAWRAHAGKALLWLNAPAVFCLGLAVSSFAIHQDNDGSWTNDTVALMVAAIVLAFVYYIYQRDFFLVTLDCAVGVLGVMLFAQIGRSSRTYVLLVVAALVLLAVAILTRILQKHGGQLTLGGRSRRILPARANYPLVYISCALVLVLLVAALFLVGSGIPTTVFYAVPVAWFIIMAVYYTVKMM